MMKSSKPTGDLVKNRSAKFLKTLRICNRNINVDQALTRLFSLEA